MHRSPPGLKSISEISADAKIEQTGQENEDVPGAIQQSWTIRDTYEMVVKLIHVLTGQQETNYDQYSEYEMSFLHPYESC